MYIHDTQDTRNFKALRIENCIKQEEVAKRAGFYRGTVIRLEAGDPSIKDETYDILYRALINLIEERPKCVIHDMTSYNNILGYLSENHIEIKEFASMCGFYPSTFTPSHFKNGIIPDNIINKIKAATGWTDDQIKNNDIKGGTEMSYVPVLKKNINLEECDYDETKMISKTTIDIDSPEVADAFYDNSDREIKNERYDCLIDRDTGVKTYICEYDEVITRHHTKTITREEFLKEV